MTIKFTDAELEYLLNNTLKMVSWNHHLIDNIIRGADFTDEQLSIVCRFAAHHGNSNIVKMSIFLTHHMFGSHHLDILIGGSCDKPALEVFKTFCDLEPCNIDTGLKSRYKEVRDAAYNHPCCTEEQKVWYHLTHSH